MKKAFVVALIMGLSLTACSNEDSSPIAAGTRNVQSFEAIEVDGALNVDVNVGQPQSITVECNQDSMSRVHTVVESGVLKVFIDNNINPEYLAVHILVPDLKALTLSGSTKAGVTGLKGDKFDLSTSGAASVKLQGNIKNLTVNITGSGSVKSDELSVDNCSVSITGSGAADMFASEKLDAKITGSGSVRVHGNPKVTHHITGSGAVQKI